MIMTLNHFDTSYLVKAVIAGYSPGFIPPFSWVHIFVLVAEILADCFIRHFFWWNPHCFAELQVLVGRIHIDSHCSWYFMSWFPFRNFGRKKCQSFTTGARMGLFSSQVERWGASANGNLTKLRSWPRWGLQRPSEYQHSKTVGICTQIESVSYG